MGFFSHFRPSLKNTKEEAEKTIQNTDEEVVLENIEKPIVVDQPFTNTKKDLIDGVDIVGLNSQIKQAEEIIHNVRLSNISQPIKIIGPKGSGKSVLSKTIMQRNGISYKRIFLDQLAGVDELLSILEGLMPPLNSGLILEGADEITKKKDIDWELIDVVNKLLTKDEVTFFSGKKLYLSRMTIIITLRKADNRYLHLENTKQINISYKRDDFVKMYLRFCRESGHDFPANNVSIDNKVVSYMGTLLGNNIVFFRCWSYRLMQMGNEYKGEGRLTVRMKDLIDLTPDMLDFDHIYSGE